MQLSAIGTVAAEWAMLEWALHAWGASIFRTVPAEFGVLTKKPSGSELAKILAEAAPPRLKEWIDARVLKTLFARVEKAAGERNTVCHGVWGDLGAIIGGRQPWPLEDPASNVVVKNRGVAFHQSRWTAARMLQLADRIAQIRLDLNDLLHPLPWPIGRDFQAYLAAARAVDVLPAAQIASGTAQDASDK
jgi:hypothetical protein